MSWSTNFLRELVDVIAQPGGRKGDGEQEVRGATGDQKPAPTRGNYGTTRRSSNYDANFKGTGSQRPQSRI